MKTKLLLFIFSLFSLVALADGPVIQTTPFTRTLLRAPDQPTAQTDLGMAGGTNGVALTVISNVANLALAPSLNTTSNAFQNAIMAPTNYYNVKSFGAFGDGHFASVVSTTNRAGVTDVFTTNANFTAGDVGDQIGICAAGNHAHTWFSLITAVHTTNWCTISNQAPVLLTNDYYIVYGRHDDTAAIQATINQVTNSGGGIIYVPPGVYLIGGQAQATNQNNAQIIIPPLMANQSAQYSLRGVSCEIEIVGSHPFRGWGTDGVGGIQPGSDMTVLADMVIGNDNVSSNGFGESMFNGGAYGVPGVLYSYGVSRWPDSDCEVIFKNLGIVTSYSPHLAVLNMIGNADGSGAYNVNIEGGSPSGGAFFTNTLDGTNDYAIIMPGNFEGTFGILKYCTVSGFWNGVECGLVDADDCTINECTNAIDIYLSNPIDLAGTRAIFQTVLTLWLREAILLTVRSWTSS
jgi:hypothetical protein